MSPPRHSAERMQVNAAGWTALSHHVTGPTSSSGDNNLKQRVLNTDVPTSWDTQFPLVGEYLWSTSICFLSGRGMEGGATEG